MDQGLWQFHLQLLHQGANQGIAAVAGLATFGVVLEPLFQLLAQLRQGLLFAGLLGKGVIQLRQLAGFEVLQLDLEGRLAAAGVLLGIVVRELAVDGFAVAHCHADHPFDEAGDHPAMLEVHIHGVGAATFDLRAVIAVGAFEPEHSDVALFRRAALDRHHRGQLLAGVLQHLVDFGGVVSHRFKAGFQPFGAFELGRGGNIRLEGDRDGFAGCEGIQQPFEATAEFRLADRFEGFLLDGIAPGAIHHGFQGRGLDPHGTKLLNHHRPRHLALAEPRQVDAAAEAGDRVLVAGLGALSRDRHGHRQTAAGAAFGGHLQGGSAHGGIQKQQASPTV